MSLIVTHLHGHPCMCFMFGTSLLVAYTTHAHRMHTHTCVGTYRMLSIEDHLKRKMKKAESIAPPPKKAKVEQKVCVRI